MKARRVKGLDPRAPLSRNAAQIVAVRLDELCSFMPRAADPSAWETLHDMRIAAKRLRYVLETTAGVLGPQAHDAATVARELQDLLGEIHDCDVQIPATGAVLDRLVAEDAAALVARGETDPGAAPNRAAYAGIVGAEVRLRARRELLFGRFLARWQELERDGFRARLERSLDLR